MLSFFSPFAIKNGFGNIAEALRCRYFA